jgi:signal peptidase I
VSTPDDPVATAATGAAETPDGSLPAGPAPKRRRQRSFWRELPFLVVVALVLALVIKTFLVQAFYIPSASMEPTLEGGSDFGGAPPNLPFDRVLVNKLVYHFRDPHRGEIVVFRKPSYWTTEAAAPATTGIVHYLQDLEAAVGIPVNNTEDIIKRVIGVPGDVVRCAHPSAGGKSNGFRRGSSVLTVDGHRLTEPYLYPGSSECGPDNFTVKVPAGHLWVMGDHRDDSDDSRGNMQNAEHGTIPIANVVGRAFAVIWPPKDWKTLSVPATFGQPGLSADALSAPVLGVAGALPITLVRRRRIRRGRRSLVRRLVRR